MTLTPQQQLHEYVTDMICASYLPYDQLATAIIDLVRSRVQVVTPSMANAGVDVDSLKLGDISPLGFRMSPQQLMEKCFTAMLAAGPLGEKT